jgi:ATP-dependent protease Clp ATPase subunit
MVPEGIVGYSIGELGKDILKKADYDMHKAKHCVVFFDEMDKLFSTQDASDYGDKIASQLLRLIEGTKIKLSHSTYSQMNTDEEELDTSNMQFILGGAFQWILDSKSETEVTVGFAKEKKLEQSKEISLEDLYRENIPKELLGRMNTIVNLKKLSVDNYFKILKTSKSSPLQEFINKVEFHGDTVEISDDTLYKVAMIAANSELGVRAVKQTLRAMFSEALFLAADGECKTHIIEYI